MIHATIPPVISLFHDSTPPIGKCVLRRNGMYDDLDTNWGEFAIKNPLNPARRKIIGPDRTTAFWQPPVNAVTAL